jgi:hypothetical protein
VDRHIGRHLREQFTAGRNQIKLRLKPRPIQPPQDADHLPLAAAPRHFANGKQDSDLIGQAESSNRSTTGASGFAMAKASMGC